MYELGFLGGGQLARMSIQAAQRMGLKCFSLDPGAITPASQISDAVVGQLDDPECIAQILRSCERITLENEFIPAESIRLGLALAGRTEDCVTPGLETLHTIQDKLLQRRAFARSGISSPRAVAVIDVEQVTSDMGFPMVLKARFGGYDGKGTRYARTVEELKALETLWSHGGWLAEEFVPFRRELAVMVFIGEREGCFPTMETVQQEHVCDLVFPCDADGSAIALAAVKAVGGRGLFGVELFELPDGSMSVNEIAPRPHNSGHYTLDSGGTSQFEQHVRVAVGFGCGSVGGLPVCMANLLGKAASVDLGAAIRAASVDPAVHVHWYGKAESRPGRKMGHLNVVGVVDLVERAKLARSRFMSGKT